MTVCPLFTSVINSLLPIVKAIPKGFKDNAFFYIDNSDIFSCKQNSKHSNFSDDCGSWDTHNGCMMKTDFILNNNSLKFTIKKDDSYYYETNIKERKC